MDVEGDRKDLREITFFLITRTILQNEAYKIQNIGEDRGGKEKERESTLYSEFKIEIQVVIIFVGILLLCKDKI